MKGVLMLERAILHQLKLVGSIAAVLFRSVILLLTLRALKSNLFYRSFLFVRCHVFISSV